MMENKPTYREAFEELQRIVSEMESGQIDVDDLLEKVSRASELIKICKEKLYTTENNVKKVLADMQGNAADDDTEDDDTEDDDTEDEYEENEDEVDEEEPEDDMGDDELDDYGNSMDELDD